MTIPEDRISDLVQRAYNQQLIALNGEQSNTPPEVWTILFQRLTNDEFQAIEALSDAELGVFFFDDYQDQPQAPLAELWEKTVDLFVRIEEEVYGS